MVWVSHVSVQSGSVRAASGERGSHVGGKGWEARERLR